MALDSIGHEIQLVLLKMTVQTSDNDHYFLSDWRYRGKYLSTGVAPFHKNAQAICCNSRLGIDLRDNSYDKYGPYGQMVDRQTGEFGSICRQFSSNTSTHRGIRERQHSSLSRVCDLGLVLSVVGTFSGS